MSEKPVAWLITRPKKDSSVEKEVVLSPLTDDTILDDGDEAWPLYFTKHSIIEELISWAEERKQAETAQRPDTNIHKRTLIETWDQVIRKLADL